jgi:hypothetical protein
MKPIKSIYGMIILVAVTMVPTLQLSAQDEGRFPGTAPLIPVEGYVILNDGETLYGKIRWTLKYVENNPVEIKFYAENGATISYDAGEIKGFGNRIDQWIEGNPIPISLEMENYVSVLSYKKKVPVFMNRLIDGIITVYQNRSSVFHSSSKVIEKTRMDGINFTFSFDDGLSIGPNFRTEYNVIYRRTGFSSYYVSKDSEPLVKVDKDNYEALFKTLFGDCPAIDQEIERNPDLMKFKNFMIVAEVYNQVCQVESGPR